MKTKTIIILLLACTLSAAAQNCTQDMRDRLNQTYSLVAHDDKALQNTNLDALFAMDKAAQICYNESSMPGRDFSKMSASQATWRVLFISVRLAVATELVVRLVKLPANYNSTDPNQIWR